MGRLGSPDIFEEPLHQLDFVYGHKFAGGWALKFKAQNLLDQSVQFRQGDKLARSYRRGRSFSLALSWDWGE